MNTHQHHGHLGADRLQAFLDEELPRRERHLAEEHLASCARCSSELEAWRTLFADLGGLGTQRPHEGFADRVMLQVSLPTPRSLPERVRDRAAAWLGLGSSGHLAPETAQDLVDGLLPTRQAARVRRHLEGCGSCAHEVEGWAALARKLGTLPELRPSLGFEDAVMAQVAVPSPALERRPSRQASWQAGWLVAARRFLPQTRRAWAALSGAAVTPVATLGLLAWVVFSHRQLTPGALLSYLAWQAADLAAVGWSTAMAQLGRAAGALGLQDVLGAAATAPGAVVAGALAYSLLVVLAFRVLYKNLIAARSMDIRHAQISRS